MALTYRFYRSTQIGDGSKADPFRSKLTQYIVDDGASGFWDWLNPIRGVRYSLAKADSTLHATIAADPDIMALSPELADLAALNAWLDQSITPGPTLINRLENDGISTAWMSGPTTARELLRYAGKLHVFYGDFMVDHADAVAFVQANLDTTIGNLPQAVRTSARNWITGKGLDVSWIQNATTVRQVLQYILENITWPNIPFGSQQL